MSAGKGDSPRNCFSREYRDSYDRIFGKATTITKKQKPSTLDLRPSTQPGRTVPPNP